MMDIEHNSPSFTDRNSGRCTSSRFSKGAPPALEPVTPTSFSSAFYSSSEYTPSLRRQLSDGTRSIRIPPSPQHAATIPSPSRSRLDREYSRRLTQSETTTISSPPSINRSVNRNDLFFAPSPTDTPSSGSKFFPPDFNEGTTIDSQTSNSGTVFRTPEKPKRWAINSLSPSSQCSMKSSSVSPTSSFTSSRYSTSEITSIAEHSVVGYSDRFIPSRLSSKLNFSALEISTEDYHSVQRTNDQSNITSNSNGPTPTDGTNEADNDRPWQGNNENSRQPPLLNMLLRSELLGENITENSSPNRLAPGMSPSHRNDKVFRFSSSGDGGLRESTEYYQGVTSVVKAFNLSPVGSALSHRLLASPQKRKRRISKVPFKVLDAPALQDDFYLNLVDWSSLNVLAVGLGSCVYLWSACTSKVTKLCDLSNTEDAVTSVSWTQRGNHLAVGTNRGELQLWDATKCKKIRTLVSHTARIGTLSWNGTTLASGSRDRVIYLRDMRSPEPYISRLASHKQEVCGLKWSFDEPAQLASGGNDNKLLIWDIKNATQPVHRFTEHTAAVKAIAWSPHQHGLLASGGGTADRCIRFWNAQTGTRINCIDTGSQVCNLAWSRNCNELVSTHGYSLNQIVVWRYPTMSKVATLTGHTYRVLYLAVSPDGSTIVTGAGDETLRFWQIFPGPRSHDKSTCNGLLFPPSPGSTLR